MAVSRVVLGVADVAVIVAQAASTMDEGWVGSVDRMLAFPRYSCPTCTTINASLNSFKDGPPSARGLCRRRFRVGVVTCPSRMSSICRAKRSTSWRQGSITLM